MSQNDETQLQGSNTEKDPDEWVTGDEAMTGAQKSYLKTLSEEAGEDFDETLTKAQASERIDELQQRTRRGSHGGGNAGHGSGGHGHADGQAVQKQGASHAQGRRH